MELKKPELTEQANHFPEVTQLLSGRAKAPYLVFVMTLCFLGSYILFQFRVVAKVWALKLDGPPYNGMNHCLYCAFMRIHCAVHVESVTLALARGRCLTSVAIVPTIGSWLCPNQDFMTCWGLGDTNTGAAVGCGFPGGQAAKEKCVWRGGLWSYVTESQSMFVSPGHRGMEVWAEHVQGSSKITPPPPANRCALLQAEGFPVKKAPCSIYFKPRRYLGLKEVKAVVI